jgi:aspartate kinase
MDDITTLGRGGSDTTAVAVASALDAKYCEIFTDVSGVYTTDPNIVTNAKKISVVSYDEMLELSFLGSESPSLKSCRVCKKA